jgi:hypothetical protein
MTFLRNSILALVIALCSLPALSQRVGGGTNLERFDMRLYHFGFLISSNTSSFFIDRKPNFTFSDSLLRIENVPQSGFNLALLASFNPVKNVNIRFLPGLSFQDRGINYTFLQPDGLEKTFLKRTESVFIDFPVLLKLRTNRSNNFAAYALFGGKFSKDMQSQKDVNNAVAEQIVIKLKDKDVSLDMGGGFDFFLPYFKFAIEFKTSIGLNDILIHEDTPFSNPIESLRTRSFIVSFTFEG